MPRISVKRILITWFLAGIEEDEEARRWMTLSEALAEAITDTLHTADAEIDARSSSLEELSETTSTSETHLRESPLAAPRMVLAGIVVSAVLPGVTNMWRLLNLASYTIAQEQNSIQTLFFHEDCTNEWLQYLGSDRTGPDIFDVVLHLRTITASIGYSSWMKNH
ncbi:hypothetical protein EV426DRAFT_640011 [Tirmania nivea]|nr:hypothetical protein EV426DRAFT_640011 [Tirmania nivea]